MNTRKTVAIGFVLFAAPVVLHFLYEAISGAASASTPSPFLVPEVTLEFREVLDSPSQRRIATRRVVAYRADGAFSETVRKFRRNGEEMRTRTLRFPDGRRVIADDTVRVKSTWNPPEAEFARWRDSAHLNPASQCVSNLRGETGGRTAVRIEERSGFQAVLIRNTLAPGIESWHAPALGCLEVGRVMRFAGQSGQESDASELILEQHRLGAPDAALFELAGGYDEAGPVEAARRLYTKMNAPPVYIERLMADPSLKRLAESYAAANPAR